MTNHNELNAWEAVLCDTVELITTMHMSLSLTQHPAKVSPLITHLTLGRRKEVDGLRLQIW